MHSKLTTFHDASYAVRNRVPSKTGNLANAVSNIDAISDPRFISVGARHPPMLVNFSRLPLPSSPVHARVSIRYKQVLMAHGPISLTLKLA